PDRQDEELAARRGVSFPVHLSPRHCEELLRRSNPETFRGGILDCFAALAMTEEGARRALQSTASSFPSAPEPARACARRGVARRAGAAGSRTGAVRRLVAAGRPAACPAAIRCAAFAAWRRSVAPEWCRPVAAEIVRCAVAASAV